MNKELCREIQLIESNRRLRNQITVLNREIERLKEENKNLKIIVKEWSYDNEYRN